MGAGVGVLEAAALLSGGMTVPLEGPTPPAGGPDSVSGARDWWLVARCTNDATRRAGTAMVMRMFTGRAMGPLRDWPATDPHRYCQSSPGRTDRRDPLSLGGHGDDGVDVLTFKPDFHNSAPPTWHTRDVGGNDTYGIAGTPFCYG